jgi:hypothetical protein
MSPTHDVNRTIPASDKGATSTDRLLSRDRHSGSFHIALILLVGTLVRIPFYLATRPVWAGDSQEYAAVYDFWVNNILFLGERTPVYPFFLGFAQWVAGVPPAAPLGTRAAYAAILLQSMVDVLAAPIFYLGLRTLRISPRIAFVATLFLATIPAVCNYEMFILNMSFSFAWLVLVTALFLFVIGRIEAGKPIAALSIATGVAASLAVLNRPEFLIFLLLLLAFTAMLRTAAPPALSAKPLPKVALLIALAAAPAILGWMTIMYVRIGEFRITTFEGWNRSRTVYNLFDRVGPEDKVIGEIMARTYRQQQQSGSTNLREIMWPAEDELVSNYAVYPWGDSTFSPTPFHQWLTRAAQRNFGWIQIPCKVQSVPYCFENMRVNIDVGDYLGSVSSKLARRYPGVWLANIASNFAEESFNFDYSGVRPARLGLPDIAPDGNSPVINRPAATMVGMAVRLHAPLLLFTYLVTLACFVLSPVIVFRKHDEYWLRDAAVATLAVASVGTIVGTCVLAGFNRVYSLPHLVVFTICTAYAWENRSRIAAAVFRRSR